MKQSMNERTKKRTKKRTGINCVATANFAVKVGNIRFNMNGRNIHVESFDLVFKANNKPPSTTRAHRYARELSRRIQTHITNRISFFVGRESISTC